MDHEAADSNSGHAAHPDALTDDALQARCGDMDGLVLAIDAEEGEDDSPGDPIPAWERQPGEPVRAYHAFCHFRDQKVHSIFAAYREHRAECDHNPVAPGTKVSKHWVVWSSHWGWVARSAAWDAEIDRQAREKILTAQIEGRERHARLGQALLSVMTLPVKAALEASRDGKMIQQLIASAQHDAQGAYQLLAAVARMAQVASGVVTMERQALGLSSVETPVAHEDSREFDLAFANRVIADPEATDMAIALLHRVAGGTGAPPAERLGAPRQPGEVADGSPSQPADEEAGGLGAAPDHAPLGGTAA